MAKRKKKSAMTDSTLTRLPLLAGSAVAASLSRAGLWTFSRYMRAPLASTALMAMVTLTALAGSNALYFQTARHPAPLFAPAPDVPDTASVVAAPAAPVLPQLRQAEVPQPVSQEITSSVTQPEPVVPDAPVGNTQVFELQKKLTELKLFNGTVDGFYGPMTARAIRAFEERNGMTPTGAISPALVDAILRADAMGMAPQPVRVAEIAPEPVAAPVVRAAQAQLPPVPLGPVRVVQPETPVEDAFDAVTNSAAQTIDSIVAAVDGSRVTPAAPALRPTPSRPLLAATAQPMPAVVQRVASLEPMAPPAVIVPKQAEPQQLAALAPTAAVPAGPTSNAQLIEQVQRGLASLGFLQGAIDGKPGEATARAIRAFEIFHNYAPTGEANPQLLGLLRDAGASI